MPTRINCLHSKLFLSYIFFFPKHLSTALPWEKLILWQQEADLPFPLFPVPFQRDLPRMLVSPFSSLDVRWWGYCSTSTPRGAGRCPPAQGTASLAPRQVHMHRSRALVLTSSHFSKRTIYGLAWIRELFSGQQTTTCKVTSGHCSPTSQILRWILQWPIHVC